MNSHRERQVGGLRNETDLQESERCQPVDHRLRGDDPAPIAVDGEDLDECVVLDDVERLEGADEKEAGQNRRVAGTGRSAGASR